MAGGESKSVVVDTSADSKVADENAKTLKRALPQVWLHRIKVLFILSRHILRLIDFLSQVPGITEKQPANSNVKQLANSNVKQPANSNVESLARRSVWLTFLILIPVFQGGSGGGKEAGRSPGEQAGVHRPAGFQRLA